MFDFEFEPQGKELLITSESMPTAFGHVEYNRFQLVINVKLLLSDDNDSMRFNTSAG